MPRGVSLTVRSARLDEVFTDTVRIAERNRIDFDNTIIPNGTVVRIDHANKKAYAIVRGQTKVEEQRDTIFLDEFMRVRLGIEPGQTISNCHIRSATPFEKVVWYLYATNPAVHVPARIAAWSLAVGVISVIVGVVSLELAVRAMP